MENRNNIKESIGVENKKPRKKRKITLRGVLTFLVVLVTIRQAMLLNFENVFVGVLTLILFALPKTIERRADIEIPALFETIIYCFIFAAEILGEVESFFTRVPMWDVMLHGVTGFLMAAVGFGIIDFFNRSRRFSIELSPKFLALVAFCFSMTIGVLWELFEFAVDLLFAMDMQKDTVIHSINSVSLDPNKLNVVWRMDIESLVVNGEDWMARFGGYLDIGLFDTMKDLFVNFIGALIFSILGAFYMKRKGWSGKFAKNIIPTVKNQ